MRRKSSDTDAADDPLALVDVSLRAPTLPEPGRSTRDAELAAIRREVEALRQATRAADPAARLDAIDTALEALRDAAKLHADATKETLVDRAAATAERVADAKTHLAQKLDDARGEIAKLDAALARRIYDLTTELRGAEGETRALRRDITGIVAEQTDATTSALRAAEDRLRADIAKLRDLATTSAALDERASGELDALRADLPRRADAIIDQVRMLAGALSAHDARDAQSAEGTVARLAQFQQQTLPALDALKAALGAAEERLHVDGRAALDHARELARALATHDERATHAVERLDERLASVSQHATQAGDAVRAAEARLRDELAAGEERLQAGSRVALEQAREVARALATHDERATLGLERVDERLAALQQHASDHADAVRATEERLRTEARALADALASKITALPATLDVGEALDELRQQGATLAATLSQHEARSTRDAQGIDARVAALQRDAASAADALRTEARDVLDHVREVASTLKLHDARDAQHAERLGSQLAAWEARSTGALDALRAEGHVALGQLRELATTLAGHDERAAHDAERLAARLATLDDLREQGRAAAAGIATIAPSLGSLRDALGDQGARFDAVSETVRGGVHALRGEIADLSRRLHDEHAATRGDLSDTTREALRHVQDAVETLRERIDGALDVSQKHVDTRTADLPTMLARLGDLRAALDAAASRERWDDARTAGEAIEAKLAALQDALDARATSTHAKLDVVHASLGAIAPSLAAKLDGVRGALDAAGDERADALHDVTERVGVAVDALASDLDALRATLAESITGNHEELMGDARARGEQVLASLDAVRADASAAAADTLARIDTFASSLDRGSIGLHEHVDSVVERILEETRAKLDALDHTLRERSEDADLKLGDLTADLQAEAQHARQHVSEATERVATSTRERLDALAATLHASSDEQRATLHAARGELVSRIDGVEKALDVVSHELNAGVLDLETRIASAWHDASERTAAASTRVDGALREIHAGVAALDPVVRRVHDAVTAASAGSEQQARDALATMLSRVDALATALDAAREHEPRWAKDGAQAVRDVDARVGRLVEETTKARDAMAASMHALHEHEPTWAREGADALRRVDARLERLAAETSGAGDALARGLRAPLDALSLRLDAMRDHEPAWAHESAEALGALDARVRKLAEDAALASDAIATSVAASREHKPAWAEATLESVRNVVRESDARDLVRANATRLTELGGHVSALREHLAAWSDRTAFVSRDVDALGTRVSQRFDEQRALAQDLLAGVARLDATTRFDKLDDELRAGFAALVSQNEGEAALGRRVEARVGELAASIAGVTVASDAARADVRAWADEARASIERLTTEIAKLRDAPVEVERALAPHLGHVVATLEDSVRATASGLDAAREQARALDARLAALCEAVASADARAERDARELRAGWDAAQASLVGAWRDAQRELQRELQRDLDARVDERVAGIAADARSREDSWRAGHDAVLARMDAMMTMMERAQRESSERLTAHEARVASWVKAVLSTQATLKNDVRRIQDKLDAADVVGGVDADAALFATLPPDRLS